MKISRNLGFAAGIVGMSLLSAAAETWRVFPDITNGMTGPQQITNALAQLSSGDTILVDPGIYDFTGISMRTDTFESGGNTYVITNHLTRDIAFTLKGNTSGHWDDAIVFKGNGRCVEVKGIDTVRPWWRKKCYFNNITFDGFDCQRYPSEGSFHSRGGALRLEDNTDYHTVSNCVIRNCSAYIAGAVNGGVLVDCLATNNYSFSHGGVGSNTRFESCRVVYNRADGLYGASYSQWGVFNSYFEGNSGAGCGTFFQGSNFVCSNNTFVANVSRDNGGAINLSGTKDVIDCTFIGNVATNAGGAIYISSSTGAKIRGCTFISNSVARAYNTGSQYGGGAIYSSISSAENTISNCTFIGNWTEGTYGGATVNGVYEDCTFISNRAEKISGGACCFNNATGAVMRCVFLENMATNGGALKAVSNVVVVECAFTNNSARYYGGAVSGPAVCSNCTFSANNAQTYGGAIYEDTTTASFFVECVFTNNMLTSTNNTYGGAIYGNNQAMILAERCVFVGNLATNGYGRGYGGALSVAKSAAIIDCAFTNNFASSRGGAIYGPAACTNCTFTGNIASYRGGALCESEAVDCVFRGNTKRAPYGTSFSQSEYGGGCAYKSRLVRCDCTDAAFWQCSLVDCSIHDVVNSIAPCIFYEENWATNCLVSGCTGLGSGLFYRYLWKPGTASDYRGAKRGSMVNCTFADNSVSRADTFYVANSHKTNEFDFVNCIFHNNKVTGAKVADLSGALVVGVTLQNCIYGVSDGTLSWEDKGGNIECADPKFAKNFKDGSYPYYMPKSNSPAVNAGLTADWMSTATDLCGTNRVLNARVDIGCYESYIPFFGTAILFR